MVEYTSSKDFNVKQYADEGGGGMVHYKVIAAAVKLLKRSEKMCAKAIRNCAYEKERADMLALTATRLKTELESQDSHHGRNQVRKAKLDNFARANHLGSFVVSCLLTTKFGTKHGACTYLWILTAFIQKYPLNLTFPTGSVRSITGSNR